MSTTFRTKSATTYKNRYTIVQLASTIRQLQRQFVTISKQPSWKTVNGKTTVQRCTAIANEIKKIARVMRAKTVQKINAHIRTLKSSYAGKIGVKISSTKTNTSAVKRLKAKITQINRANRVSTVVNICTKLKLSAFKNPVVRNVTVSKTRTTTARRRTTRTTGRRTSTGARRTNRSKRTSVTAVTRQTRTLKKQLTSLKRRNSLMKRLVNKFRKNVAALKRSYHATSARPRWTVYQGQGQGRGTSNVVRFNRGTSSNWNRQAQRRYG